MKSTLRSQQATIATIKFDIEQQTNNYFEFIHSLIGSGEVLSSD